MEAQKIHWRPQVKQSEALVRTENEILYGGARGGGKTDAGQAWLLYDIGEPRYRALVIRRNADDLKDWIDRARRMYEPTGAEFSGNPTDIKFPSGAIIRTGHLKDENAYTKYQGHEYQKILIEELTHIPRESDYEKLLGSCRSTISGISPQIFCTTNPDGPGYSWVKNRFAIPDEPKETIVTTTKDGRSRVFIPARVEDNPKLTTADPQYITYLESIQDVDLRKAWREGSWAGVQVEGAYYRAQINKARADGRITSVPYDANALVHTWWDLGMNDSTAIGFFQNIGQEIHWIDSFAGEGEGLAYYVAELSARGYSYGNHYFPHDIEVRELGTGKSRKEVLEGMGIVVQVVPNIPINDGINAVRGMFSRLWIDAEKNKEAIHAISNYRKEFDEKRGTYKDRPRHDWTSHYADMVRYKAVTPDLSSQPIEQYNIPTFRYQ
jgi:hypothetical protein